MDPCVWHQCIDPPLPDTSDRNNLKYIWDGVTPLEFNETVRYECINQAHWFEHDRDYTHFDLMCENDGGFSEPTNWPKCVNSKFD